MRIDAPHNMIDEVHSTYYFAIKVEVHKKMNVLTYLVQTLVGNLNFLNTLSYYNKYEAARTRF